MKKPLQQVKDFYTSLLKKIPSERRLPFFTLSFTLAALVITIIAVQQQQNLVQNAAENECPIESPATELSREDRQATRAAKRAERGKSGKNGNESVTEIPGETEVTVAITNTGTPPTINGSANSRSVSSIEKERRVNGIKGQLLVRYKKGKNKKRVDDKVKKHKGKLKKRNDSLKVDVVVVPAGEETAALNDIKNDPDVASVERDYPGFALALPNDKYFHVQYGLHNTGQKIEDLGITTTNDVDIDAPEAWEKTEGGVKVAVIDSGIEKNHPDLKGKVVGNKNFTTLPDGDKFGHGTAVAGIIAANTNNNEGIAGTCPKCTLLDAKVLDDTGITQSQETMAEAIHWAVDSGAQVINMSIGSMGTSSVLEEAVDYAWNKNVLIVASAGNCGDEDFKDEGCDTQNQKIYPAALENVVAVGAVDYNGKTASFSERGDWVDVVAPGVSIATTAPTTDYVLRHDEKTGNEGSLSYAYFDGTSFATPMVAGVAALAYSAGHETAAEVRGQLENTAQDVAGSGSDAKHGMVNAAAAVGGEATDEDPTSSGSAQPSCKPKKDKNKNTDKKKNREDKKDTKDKKNDSSNREPNNPKKAICSMLPSLPFCRGNNTGNTQTGSGRKDICPTKSPGNTSNPNKNSKGGSGRDGQENTSNKESNVQIGEINDDDTTDTTVTINGQAQSNQGSSNIGDINTGGQTGGNHETIITITQNGGNQTDDQSGGNGNQPNSNSKGGKNNTNGTDGDCGNGSDTTGTTKDKSNNKNKDTKAKDKGKRSSGGSAPSLICRLFPFFGSCKRDDTRNAKNDRSKNDKKDTKDSKKDDKKSDKKDVKAATDAVNTTAYAKNVLVYNALTTCLSADAKSACTMVMKEVADISGDGAVDSTDFSLYTQ